MGLFSLSVHIRGTDTFAVSRRQHLSHKLPQSFARGFSQSSAIALWTKDSKERKVNQRLNWFHRHSFRPERASQTPRTSGTSGQSDRLGSHQDAPQDKQIRRSRLLFCLSMPLIVFLVPATFSAQRDQELVDIVEGGSGPVKSIFKRFQFPSLTGLDYAHDRNVLTQVLRHRQALSLGKTYRRLRQAVLGMPKDVQDFVHRNFLWISNW